MKDKTRIYDKDEIKLVLLPPNEDEEVTYDDVKNFYCRLIWILSSNDF